MVKSIIPSSSKSLRLTAKPVDFKTDQCEKLIQDLYDTMDRVNARGLSAPEVGVPLRAITVDSNKWFENLTNIKQQEFFADDRGLRQAFNNPEILNHSWENSWEAEEDCLCFPKVKRPVSRYWQITLKYHDTSGLIT